MKQFYKKLIPSVLCFIMIIGNMLSVFGDGGSFSYSKLFVKNGSGIYENTTSNIITLKNYPTKVTIKRTDTDGKVNVSGATIKIFDSNGDEVISFTSGEEPKTLNGVLNVGESYTIRETSPAYGHTPEVSELEIEVQNIADEQVFVIKDKVDDENGYWQLFNNDNTLKSSVKKEKEVGEVSSGERSFSIDSKGRRTGPNSWSAEKTKDSPDYDCSGYQYLKITSIVGNRSYSSQMNSEYFYFYNSSIGDLGVGAIHCVGFDIGTNYIEEVCNGEPIIINISNVDTFKVRYTTNSPYAQNGVFPEYTFTYELIKEEEVSSFPKGFTKSKFYFYNDLERSVAGLSDRSAFFTTSEFDKDVNSAYISSSYNSENDLEHLTDDDLSKVKCVPDNNSYKIDSAEFVPKYEVSYYLVKINGEEFKIKLETINTGIEVYGFQINASNSDGSASEYCPSFRTMSRSDKLQVKSDDNSDNKQLYPVENYGTVYAPDSVDDSEMTVLSDKAMHYQAHDEGFFENYNNDEYSMYYALTLKNLFYKYHNLTDKYKFRAYCELEDGTIIYSDNICTASVKDVAEAVYDKKISYSNITHQWIYDYVIYPTSLKSNIVDITYFLLEMTEAQSKDDLEYALCNQWYKDANYWCNNSFDYEKVSYYDRGTKFVCTSEITYNGKTYNVESTLLEILNDISVTKYDTVSDWIYYNQKDYQFEGIAYQKEFVNNQMIIFD